MGNARVTPAQRKGDRQQGETAKHRGAAHTDANPAPRKGWATSQRAPTQPVQLTTLTPPPSKEAAENRPQFGYFLSQGAGRGRRKHWSN